MGWILFTSANKNIAGIGNLANFIHRNFRGATIIVILKGIFAYVDEVSYDNTRTNVIGLRLTNRIMVYVNANDTVSFSDLFIN